MLTPEEIAFVEAAGELMNAFCRIPPAHPSDTREVEAHVHAIQNLVMARSACREHPDKFPWLGERVARATCGECESTVKAALQERAVAGTLLSGTPAERDWR